MTVLAFRLLAFRLLAAAPATTVPPGPLGPIDQNADQVRDQACKVVSQNASTCVPATLPKPTGGSQGTGGVDFLAAVFWVLLLVGVVLLVLLLVRGAMNRSGTAKRRRTEDEDDPEDDVVEERVVAIDRSRGPSDWRAEADEHRRAGRFRDAVRCRYRALVGDLARRGLIDEIPGRTTGEHRSQMHDVRPVVAPLFDEAADLFDGAWYGHLDVDERDDDRFTALAHDVMAAANGGRR